MKFLIDYKVHIYYIGTLNTYPLGTILILRKGIGVGGPENGNFPLLYVMKMSLRRGWVGGSKKPQLTLT